jgi:AraC-like DNA-binding protein
VRDRDLRVPEELRPWVADAVLPLAAPAPLPTVRVPDPATSLVFRTSAEGVSELVVVGPQTRAGYFAGRDLPMCLRMRLRTGRVRPLLDAAPAELVDRAAPLADFWGRYAVELAERLAAQRGDPDSPDALLARLAGALLARVPDRRRLAAGELAASAARALAGGGRLPEVARGVALSERHLRTVFAAEVGLSPKHYARIDRLRGVLARAGADGWAGLARTAGYYDQAHLTADFTAMMGVPPGAWLAGRLPASTPCG